MFSMARSGRQAAACASPVNWLMRSGAHLWADRSTVSSMISSDLQDKVAAIVAGVIEPTLQSAETARRQIARQRT
jgi:hypothetical protein